MKSLLQTYGLVAVIGAVLGAAGLLVLRFGSTPLNHVLIAASDQVMLRRGGPRLGRIAPSDDIVLVMFDAPAANRYGRLNVPEADMAAYRNLVAAGAKVVADTRMIAISVESEDAAPFTALVKELEQDPLRGRVIRDIWVPGQWSDEDRKQARQVSAHQVLNLQPNRDAVLHSRIYPLATATTLSMRESMPIVVARMALDLPQPTPQDTVAELNRCGIGAVWQEMYPQFYVPSDAIAREHRDYSIDGLTLPWMKYPSSMSLIAPAGLWISYAVDPVEYPRISFLDAVDGQLEDRVRGKLVFIGIDPDVQMADACAVPSSPDRVSAAAVVANTTDTIRRKNWQRPVVPFLLQLAVFLFPIATTLLTTGLRPSYAAAAVGGILMACLIAAVLTCRWGMLGDFVVLPGTIVLAAVGGISYRFAGEFRARRRVIDLFGRYVPRPVVAQLIQQPDVQALHVGGVERDVTVLFADIRGFTAYSETLSPSDVIVQLNSLLQLMVAEVFRFEGTIDKYIGDAILVLFNAPLDQPDHVQRAIRAACAIQQAVVGHESGLAIGIGVHRGPAVVGTIGTPERMEYTAIGSTVNIASRVCTLAAAGEIVVTEQVAESLPDEFQLTPRAPTRVKGINHDLQTFRVQAGNTAQV